MSAHGTWRKSSRSGVQQNCVELAWSARDIAVRDSKNPTGPRLSFPGSAFGEFIRHVSE